MGAAHAEPSALGGLTLGGLTLGGCPGIAVGS